jgi:hypothetical protein
MPLSIPGSKKAKVKIFSYTNYKFINDMPLSCPGSKKLKV